MLYTKMRTILHKCLERSSDSSIEGANEEKRGRGRDGEGNLERENRGQILAEPRTPGADALLPRSGTHCSAPRRTPPPPSSSDRRIRAGVRVRAPPPPSKPAADRPFPPGNCVRAAAARRCGPAPLPHRSEPRRRGAPLPARRACAGGLQARRARRTARARGVRMVRSHAPARSCRRAGAARSARSAS